MGFFLTCSLIIIERVLFKLFFKPFCLVAIGLRSALFLVAIRRNQRKLHLLNCCSFVAIGCIHCELLTFEHLSLFASRFLPGDSRYTAILPLYSERLASFGPRTVILNLIVDVSLSFVYW